MGLCCSLLRARQPNGNLSSQISTCGKAGSLNSRFINNDFILPRTSSLSAKPRHFYHMGMADFISTRIRSFSAAKPSHFLSRARFIKAGQLQWPFCQQCVLPARSGQMDLRIRALRGRFHIVPYKEFISGQAEPFYQGLAKRITPAAAFYQSQWPFYQTSQSQMAIF